MDVRDQLQAHGKAPGVNCDEQLVGPRTGLDVSKTPFIATVRNRMAIPCVSLDGSKSLEVYRRFSRQMTSRLGKSKSSRERGRKTSRRSFLGTV